MSTLAAPTIPVERFTLRCGARLLVSPRPGAPVCAVQAHVRGGHSLDPPGLEGTAFLAGRLADQGTEQRTEEQIAVKLESLGGSLSGGSTGLSGTAAAGGWKDLLRLFAESLRSPTYPRDRFERQRKRLLDRLLVERDDPRARVAWLFRGLVYGDHWLGRPDFGSLESVPRIERRHLVAFHRKNRCASRALLAFCGDVEPRAVKQLLDRELRAWPTGKPLPPPDASFPERAPRARAFAADRQQVHVYLGHLGIARRDPDYPALVVMDHILGTGPGFTNRISRRLRDELGLAYTVHAAIHSSAGVLPGTFTAYIGTNPDSVDTAVEGFLREIRRMQDERVAPEELELARNYLTGSFVLGFERAGRRVQHMISAERNGLPDGYLSQLVESFGRVDAAEVQRVAREHLHPDAACLVASGPVKASHLARLVKPPRRRRSRAG